MRSRKDQEDGENRERGPDLEQGPHYGQCSRVVSTCASSPLRVHAGLAQSLPRQGWPRANSGL